MMNPFWLLMIQFVVLIAGFTAFHYVSNRVRITSAKKARSILYELLMEIADSRLWGFRYIRRALGVCFIQALMGLVLGLGYVYHDIFVVPQALTFENIFPLVILIGTLWELGELAYEAFMVWPRMIVTGFGKILFGDLKERDS